VRDYSKVSPRRWTGDTGRALRGQLEAQVVVDYLLTCQHANMLGVYYLPIAYLSVDTGMTIEGAWKGLRRAIEVGFCSYDEAAEVVWVHNMARDQIGDFLKSKDLRVSGVQREYDSLPNNAFLGRFFDLYGKAFLMERRREPKGLDSPLEGPSKYLGSQEQEQEQEQEQDGCTSPAGDGSAAPAEAAPKRSRDPKPDKPDHPAGSLPAAVASAIAADESLAPICKNPNTLAADLVAAAPGVDVVTEARKAAGWLRANPERRKTKGNDFLLRWMGRAQERCGGRGQLPFSANAATTPGIESDFVPPTDEQRAAAAAAFGGIL